MEKNIQKQIIMTKLTTNFVESTKLVHGAKYDYSKVEYVDSHTKIIIICSKHGEFKQRPRDHLSGRGCKQCVMQAFVPKSK